VQLLTEDRLIAADGKLSGVAPKPNPAATAFARSFTDSYSAIASVSPVYAELRNLMDLAIAAAWLRRESAGERIGWYATELRDENRLAIETSPGPTKAACVANAVWAGNRLLLPAGGGVSMTPDQALEPERLLATDPGMARLRQTSLAERRADSWWWDE
jgi:hypothetical protein